MPEFSNIMLSCFKKTNDFRLKTTSPHRLAQTKDQIIAHLLSVHVLARVEEFMSNGQIVHARCGKRHVTLAFSPKIRHIHRRVCCSFEFANCKGRSSPGVRRNKIQKHIRGQHATVSQIRKLPLLLNFNCIPQIFRRSKFSKKYKKNDHGALKNFLMSLLKRRPKPTGMKPGASRNSSSVFLTKVRRFCCWIVLLNCRALSKGSDFC